jgi:glycerol-3-phosphate acyltransferase PlsY
MLDCLGYLGLLFLIAFLLGSIPWGVIISRGFYHTDVREHGSGNIGTTNAMRTLGKVGGSAVFVLDFGKGVVAGIIATVFATQVLTDMTALHEFCISLGLTEPNPENNFLHYRLTQICLSVAFLGCIWGHIFSPWLKFKGGKGIAVAVGCLVSTFGITGTLLELLIFVVLVATTKYVSVGSIAAAAACPFFSMYYLAGNYISVVICTIAALTVIWAHRENIKRLLAGNENKIGDKKADAEEQTDEDIEDNEQADQDLVEAEEDLTEEIKEDFDKEDSEDKDSDGENSTEEDSDNEDSNEEDSDNEEQEESEEEPHDDSHAEEFEKSEESEELEESNKKEKPEETKETK